MAFATDAQRRWFFAHLAGGMRRIAGKMREAHGTKVDDSRKDFQRSKWAFQDRMIKGAEADLSASSDRAVRLFPSSDNRYRVGYKKGRRVRLSDTYLTHEQMVRAYKRSGS